MEHPGPADSGAGTAAEWPWQTVAGSAAGAERLSLDSAHGCALKDLLERYSPYQTGHRHFQRWVRSGVMRGVLEALALDLEARGKLNL